MTNLRETDKIAKKLKKILDMDLHTHRHRSDGDEITEPIEYFDVLTIVEAYESLRKHQKEMRRILKAIQVAGSTIKRYNLDKL